MLKAFLCSALLGSFWFLFEHNAWMALQGYVIKTSDPTLERTFWDLIPARSIRFWPFFVRDSRGIASFMERTLPVTVQTEMRGFGRFKTTIDLLTPWGLVEWRGNVWCVSKEGRMWSATDPNLKLEGLETPQRPLWRIASLSLSSSADVLPLPGGVFPSLFPLDAIKELMSQLGDKPWFKDVEEITLDRRAGKDLFKLKITRGKQVFAVLIQNSQLGWQELGFALEHILNRLTKEGGNHMIDATYEDKIVVSNLSTAAGEGSSK